MSQFEEEDEEEERIESSGVYQPTHNSSLYLYQAVITRKQSSYTFLIKAPNFLLALDELIDYISNSSRDISTVISSLELKQLVFLGSVMQI